MTGMRWAQGVIATSAMLLTAVAQAEVPIGIGESATVRLSPQRDLAFPVRPPLAHAPANHGAILSFDVDAPGRYHVVTGAPGWIDVIRDGKAVAAAGERPVAGKALDYDLAAGHYMLQLSGMADGEVEVMIGE